MMLKLGDHGEAVEELQRNLNKLGSLLLIDGDFGPITQGTTTPAEGGRGAP
jgi:peptidoglycan hydrolase-like protein with peptidoglycan-binding domain